ncbi:hypothetical protein BH20PSE1_BH20PSE1_17050 [soil metagenome]
MELDFLTFLSKAVDSLAWPAAVLAALWFFRTPFVALLEAIKEAKFKIASGGTTIEGELNTVREKLEKGPAGQVKKLVSASPTKAIETSWQELEQSAAASLSVSTQLAPLRIADLLLEKDILNEKEAEAFYKLYEIKDEATRPNSKFLTDVSSASTYSSLAHTLSEKIKQKGT